MPPMELSFIDAAGTDYEIGCAIGETLRERITSLNSRIQHVLSGREQCPLCLQSVPHDPKKYVRKTKALIRRHFPRCYDELRGLADGAGIALDEMLLSFDEESTLRVLHGRGAEPALKEKCTTFTLSCAEGVFLGHNEDWLAGYEDYLYVIRAAPTTGIPYLSLAYVGSLPGTSVAVNAEGIAFSGNMLLGDTVGGKIGIPKSVLQRSQIEARSIAEFERIASYAPRAVPNHTVAVDQKGEVVALEMSLDMCRAFHPTGSFYSHTNHPLHPDLMALEPNPFRNSLTRYAATQGALVTQAHTARLVKDILRSHEYYPDSVCKHARQDVPGSSQTLGSAIVSLRDLSMEVCLGTPCSAHYTTFRL